MRKDKLKDIEITTMQCEGVQGQQVNKAIYNEAEVGWKFWKKRRYIVSLLALFGIASSYILRVNLSIAIVAMTSNTTAAEAEFVWDSKVQGQILSAFFYGYISTLFFGGWLSARVGGKKVFGIGIGITGLTALITPFIIRYDVYLFIALRIVEGLCEGLTPTCMHAIWSNWAPPLERSKLAALAISGDSLGTIFAMFTCGIVADRYGWPVIFYVCGIIALTAASLWLYFVTDKPEDDPRISASELKFIQQSLGQVRTEKNGHPWKSIFRSRAVMAIAVAHFCENWGFYTMLTQLPKFMSDSLHFDLEKAGFCSALPYIATFIVEPIFGYLADHLRLNMLSTTQVRKLFTCTSFILQMTFMTLAAYVGTPVGAIACLIIGVGSSGISTSGYLVNYLDIAPEHASVIMGVTGTLAVLPGILSPVLSGYIVQNETVEEWRIVFIISGCIHLIGAIFYGVFGTGEKQKWAR